MSKKILSVLILSGVLAIFVMPLMASATSLTAPPATGGIADVATVIGKVFTPLWQLAAGLAVIMFIVAGILFLTSMGDPGKLATARAAVIWGVVGLIVAIIAFSIVNIVGGWFGGAAAK